jgi:hypothetical protein
MQGQNQQQAYDRGITIFSPDGRLYQVEYAREAVKRGTASVGVRTADGVVLAADRHARSPLLERDSIEKIHKADDHVGIASAGHVADARKLIDLARRQAQVEQLRYGQQIGVESLTKEVTDYIQEYTQTGGARPFGVALVVGGMEVGARSKVTLHHVVETTIEVSHLPNRATDEARLWMEHELGDVVDDYEYIKSDVERITSIYEDQRAGRRLMELER